MGGTRSQHASYQVTSDGRVVNYQKNEKEKDRLGVFLVIKMGFWILVWLFVAMPLAIYLGLAI
jgi:hypothetical protein